jgi:NCS1 family nucleobase:cation symporter-1
MSEKRIKEEVEFGILPIRPKERKYGFLDLLLVLGGFSIASWCFTQGGYLGATLHPAMIVANTLFGFAFSIAIVAIVATIFTKYGIDQWIASRSSFGMIGSSVIMIVAWLSGWGWYALNSQMFGAAADKVTTAVGLPSLPGFFWPVVVIIVPWVVAIFGPVALKWFTRIVVPAMVAVLLFMIVLVFTNTTIPELSTVEPIWTAYYPSSLYVLTLTLEWNIAFGFSWFPAMGGITRLAKGTRSTFWAMWGAYTIIAGIAVIAGAFTALYFGFLTGGFSQDPTDWLTTIGSTYGVLSLILLAMANMSTNAVGFYAVTLSTKSIFPKIRSVFVSIPWVIYLLLLTIGGWVTTFYPVFLAVVGITCAWGLGVLFGDYFLVRRQKIHVPSLFYFKNSLYGYTKGFNLIALVSLAIAVAFYFGIYDPWLSYPKHDAFLYLTASMPTFAITVGSYALLARIPAVKNYLLKQNP